MYFNFQLLFFRFSTERTNQLILAIAVRRAHIHTLIVPHTTRTLSTLDWLVVSQIPFKESGLIHA